MAWNLVPAPVPFRKLEGRRVRLWLANGAQLDVDVVSAGRGRVTSLWLDLDGADLFVEKAEILDIEEILVGQAVQPENTVVHPAGGRSY
jgi:hypothetical protein